MRLRPYQEAAKVAVFLEWQEHRSTLVVKPTGTGKTVLFAAVIQQAQPQRCLVIAHREELITQARDKIERFTGLPCEIEMADRYSNNSLFHNTPVIISTVQTQNAPYGDRTRMSRFKPEDFGVLIIDECFPAGTLVDGIPIENIKVGDTVRTHIGHGRVTRLFRKPATSMCVITFQSGETLVCTANHPIWTEKGFIVAALLTPNSVVATITDYEQLHSVQIRNTERPEVVPQSQVQVRAFPTDNPEIVQETRRGDNKVQENERDARPGSPGPSIHETEGHEVDADGPQGQRTRTYNPRTGAGFGFGVGMQRDRKNENGSPLWLSELLQTGHRKFSFEDWGGSGWLLSPSAGAAGTGPQEGGILEFERVAGVKVYEQGCGDELEWLCPEGVVYNLEVSNGNTYFAAGVLVHNCHHATAKTYLNLINYYSQNPKLKILGVTATPDRADEQALGKVFETVAFDYEILDAIHDGWLVPIEQQYVHIDGLDFSHMRTTAGDLNNADLSAVMEAEANLQGVASASLQIVGKKRCIVFTASIKQAEMLSDIYQRHNIKSDWVCGKTPKDERRSKLARFSKGEVQLMVNCGVLTEGFDDAGVECIIMARPTKSRSLYAQMCGRSTRPLPGLVDPLPEADMRKRAINESRKPCCTIVDFVGNSGRHKLMSSADILNGNASQEAVDLAKKLALKKGGAVRMNDMVDQAVEDIEKHRLELEERRQRAAARKAKVVAKATYTMKQINPFNQLDLMPALEREWDKGKSISEKQAAMLRKQGINPDGMPYAQAKQLVNELFRRFKGELCTMGQARVLKKFLLPINVKKQQAKAWLDAIAANNWRLPAELQAQQVKQNENQNR